MADRILYIDACAGASGDMLNGALLGLGYPAEELEALPAALGLTGVTARVEERKQGALAGLAIVVETSGHHHHDHDHHHQPHRCLADILLLIRNLPPKVAEAAAKVFQRLAQAEAQVHGTTVDEVHFHEVGAADAIIDVCAFCSGLAWLGWPRLVSSPLPLGRGFVDCAHGRLPLPAPAVLNLLEGIPITSWPREEETVTPTGAALISTLAQEFGPMPAMRFVGAGVGAGSHHGGYAPNVLRLLLGEAAPGAEWGEVMEIVCHLDDQSPEDLPMIFERLLKAGALDVAAAPLLMKKGRPGLELTVMADPGQADELAGLILEQTTTLGVRMRRCPRRMLPREGTTVQSPWGEVRVKKILVGDSFRLHPEADDVARICRETGLPPQTVRQDIIKAAEQEG